eukprot:373345-Pleurochrysis_carterae.AAC.1
MGYIDGYIKHPESEDTWQPVDGDPDAAAPVEADAADNGQKPPSSEEILDTATDFPSGWKKEKDFD